MSLTHARLDEIAAEYHDANVPDKFIEDAMQAHTLSWIVAQVAPCRRILELGHGEGIVTDALVGTGKSVTLLEGAASLVARARARHGASLTVVHGLFEAFVPTTRYDAIIAGHVLEHVDDPVGLLRRMRGWLTARGRVVIIVPNAESIHRRLAVRMGLQPALDTLSPRDHLVGHQRVYSLDGLRRDIRRAGYEARATRGFFFKPLANSQMLGFSPALIDAMNTIATEMPAEWLSNLGAVAVPRPPRAVQGSAGRKRGKGSRKTARR